MYIDRDFLRGAKILSVDEDDEVRCIINTSDGGYILAGKTTSVKGEFFKKEIKSHVFVIKLDNNFNEVWSKNINHTTIGKWEEFNEWEKNRLRIEHCHSVIEANDLGYLLTGSFNGERFLDEELNSTEGINGLLVIKLNKNGDIEWSKIHLDNRENFFGAQCVSIIKNNDDYILFGNVITTNLSEDHSKRKIFLLKIDRDGKRKWLGLLNIDNIITGESIAITNDRGFLVTGGILNAFKDKTRRALFVMKLNKDGEKEWLKLYADTLYSYGLSIAKTVNNTYIITGYKSLVKYENKFYNPYDEIDQKQYIDLHIDESGDIIWKDSSQDYSVDISEYSIREGKSVYCTNDNHAVVTGYYQDLYTDFKSTDIFTSRGRIKNHFVTKINIKSGRKSWIKTGFSYDTEGTDIIENNKGEYIVVGRTRSPLGRKDNLDDLNQNIFLIRYNSDGKVLPIE